MELHTLYNPASDSNSNSASIDSILADTINAIDQLFTELPGLAQSLAGKGGAMPKDPAYIPLIDGIESFTEAMQVLKPALEVLQDPTVQMLEVDLTSILTELLEANTRGDYDYQEHLLGTQILESFKDWRETGIPLLRERLLERCL